MGEMKYLVTDGNGIVARVDVICGRSCMGRICSTPPIPGNFTEQDGILQMVIFSGLTRHLGSAADVAPTATPGFGPVIGVMSVGGDSEITAEDVELDNLQTVSR